jgi:drug/metabolite transporter (DMT)-like permease
LGYLFIVSLIWAFSFGLIKDRLSGLDANFVAAVRLGISLLVFLPFLRIRRLPRSLGLALVGIGAVQFGVMYLAYIAAFRYLKAYEVALFTVFTPLYVTAIHDLFERHFHRLNLATALLAVAGAGIVSYNGLVESGAGLGFVLVQVSNLGFAFGQVAYQRWMKPTAAMAEVPADREVFGLLYLGGFLTAGLAAAVFTDWPKLTLSAPQAWTLLYLGGFASGLGFFLWNLGARKVETGTLAVFNDLKVPLAVCVAFVFFGEKANLVTLTLGGLLALGALALQQTRQRKLADMR